MSLYIENPNESTKKLWELCKILARWQDTRAIYANYLYFYTLNSEQSENEICKTIQFTIASKRIKCLGINLIKKCKSYTLKSTKKSEKMLKEI